jgi:hypothetical protein
MHAHACRQSASSRCGYIVYRDLNDFAWQLPFRVPACLQRDEGMMHLFDAVIRLSRAVIRLFEACCSAGWPSPAWDRVTVHIPACCSLHSFRFHPLDLLLLQNVNTPSPSRDSAHPLVCRSQSRRTHELHQAAMPALVIPGRIIATWELLSAAPDLWDLSACL